MARDTPALGFDGVRLHFASPHPSYRWQIASLAHAASPRLVRSLARTKRNDFPVGVTPPTSNKKMQ